MSKSPRLRVGTCLEGTAAGAIERHYFGEKIKRLVHYTQLLGYLVHRPPCMLDVTCTCGLNELLTAIPKE